MHDLKNFYQNPISSTNSKNHFKVFKRALSWGKKKLYRGKSLGGQNVFACSARSWEGMKRLFETEERNREGREVRSIEFGARASPFFSNRFRGYAAHARRVTASKLASGTVNGTTTPTATTLDVRGKEDEQREVSLAARAYDHCRPPVSRRSPSHRRDGRSNLVLRYYYPSIVFHSSCRRVPRASSLVSPSFPVFFSRWKLSGEKLEIGIKISVVFHG